MPTVTSSCGIAHPPCTPQETMSVALYSDTAVEERAECSCVLTCVNTHERTHAHGHWTVCLYEVALNHFIRGKGAGQRGNQVYFQGHASPGMYARAFLEGRLTQEQLENFRNELEPGGGLSS